MASFSDGEQLESAEVQDYRDTEVVQARKLTAKEFSHVERRQRDLFMPIANRAISNFPAAAQEAELPLTTITVKALGVSRRIQVWELFTYDNHDGAWWTYYISKSGHIYEDFQSLREYTRSTVGKAAEALYKSESHTDGSGVPGLIDGPIEDAVLSRLEDALKGHPRS